MSINVSLSTQLCCAVSWHLRCFFLFFSLSLSLIVSFLSLPRSLSPHLISFLSVSILPTLSQTRTISIPNLICSFRCSCTFFKLFLFFLNVIVYFIWIVFCGRFVEIIFNQIFFGWTFFSYISSFSFSCWVFSLFVLSTFLSFSLPSIYVHSKSVYISTGLFYACLFLPISAACFYNLISLSFICLFSLSFCPFQISLFLFL